MCLSSGALSLCQNQSTVSNRAEVYGMKAGSLDAQMAEPHEGQGWRQTQRVTMSKHAWETVSQ